MGYLLILFSKEQTSLKKEFCSDTLAQELLSQASSCATLVQYPFFKGDSSFHLDHPA